MNVDRIISGNDVRLVSGDVLKDVDVVVMATGQNRRYPLLDHIWPPEEQQKCLLYHYVVPTDPQLDGLGFIMVNWRSILFHYVLFAR